MKVNPSIFKSYDIRGIYPDELNEKIAYQVGRAFVEYTSVKKIAVGRDARLSSPALFNSLIKSIADRGVDVSEIGMVPTECVYFAAGYYEYDGGIMITASHNPKIYNGFKMLKKQGNAIEIVRGIDILEIAKKRDFKKAEKRGEIKKIDIWQDFLNHIFSFVDVNKIRPFKVVIDASNGVAGLVIDRLKEKVPLKIIFLNFKPDGNFPNHPPNPLLEGATNQISRKIKEEKADFGFIFDGDADRIFLIDEKGRFIKADTVLLFLARYFLEKNPGSAIAYNAICSKAVPEFVRKWGGKSIRTKVGFVNVREGLIENRGVVGGELSGHYSFRDNFFLDSGFIAFLILLEFFSKSEKKISQLVDELSLYAKSPEINFEIKEKEKIIEEIKKKYSDARQNYLDGVTAEYDNWWFNIRPSQTEPLLRLTIEADTQELLAEKKKELIDFIKSKDVLRPKNFLY